MKLVVDTYLEDKSKSEYNSSDIRSVAEAFSVFKPKDIDQIPDDAILNNLDVLRNNSNLSSKQVSKLLPLVDYDSPTTLKSNQVILKKCDCSCRIYSVFHVGRISQTSFLSVFEKNERHIIFWIRLHE